MQPAVFCQPWNRTKPETMYRNFFGLLLLLISTVATAQYETLKSFLADSSLSGASVSICIVSTEDGTTVLDYNSDESLMPASVLKIVTSAAALELLGPDYHFKTSIGYTGELDKRTGVLTGDLVIKGGGDPALGSPYFREHYGNFLSGWVLRLKEAGVKSVNGRVICDDSRYDYQPVPAKWLWEDIGNYYGAGVYGLSLFDNTLEIHFRTSSEGTIPEITGYNPSEARYDLSNQLVSSGNSDKGYVFSPPYGNYGWIAGTIPANRDHFTLLASIPDPPMLIASLFDKMLDSAGIAVRQEPSTLRIENHVPGEVITIAETKSPSLSAITEVLNHESVNLYAEHLLKELGLQFRGKGTTDSGIDVLYSFLAEAGVDPKGFFIEDGSGLSPLNAVTAKGLAGLLFYMEKKAQNAEAFINSLPEAGKEGTLKSSFHQTSFKNNLKAKSGSITRTRCYAGYFTASSGKEMAFSIMVNNYSGSSQTVVSGIEALLLETIVSQ